ncbi:hypothetical protein OF83DRAFT_1166825 [Amylostereum chailletii]|nr:hypothetical protein OF83DRAFT_1166825 [Amylostereum chailletii]
MSLMVLCLGGQKLLYTMNHYIAIPSIRSLRRAHIFIKLMLSLGSPTQEEICHNMDALFSLRILASIEDTAQPYQSGMSMLWNKVNKENAACYLEHLNAVGGLCREYSHQVNLWLNTIENTYTIAEAPVDSTIHYGKEASVIAMASFGRILRGVFLILISPTCKKETSNKSWHLLDRLYFGPIWSFASDGDAGRHTIVYANFLHVCIDATYPLFKYLGQLPRLNLMVRKDDVMATFDWKYEIKHNYFAL